MLGIYILFLLKPAMCNYGIAYVNRHFLGERTSRDSELIRNAFNISNGDHGTFIYTIKIPTTMCTVYPKCTLITYSY